MRTFRIALTVAVLTLSVAATAIAESVPAEDPPDPLDLRGVVVLAQGPGAIPVPPPGELRLGPGRPLAFGPPIPERIAGPGAGAWWKDSEVVKTLGLSEAQVNRVEQTYLAHRLRLVDLRADLEKQELGLQPLLDADQPDEAKVASQLDLITAARGRLEKEHALMLLAVRRVLTVEQWKKLQALQQERARGGGIGPAGGPPSHRAIPPPGSTPRPW